MIQAQPFLTAYDPSDLPGGSVDPLGFDRGYQLLAEKILPGLTNVASRPRYFAVLCAGLDLTQGEQERTGSSSVPRVLRQRRVEVALRLERLWALGCVLAAGDSSEVDGSGIRGLRYVQRAIRALEERSSTASNGDFRLLSRQHTYGMVGIYGSVAERLNLIDSDAMVPRPELGRRLADAFIEETQLPAPVRRAALEGEPVRLTTLQNWAERAHIDAVPGPKESRVLYEAFEADATRVRMGALLRQLPLVEGETELHRLGRIRDDLAARDADQDLREALSALVAFEDCFRLVLLVFFNVLGKCQQVEPFAVELDAAASDPVLTEAMGMLPHAVSALELALATGSTPAFCENIGRLSDVLEFLRSAATGDVGDTVERVLERHRFVQQGKLDRGRPKMPWLELRGRKIVPTLSLAQRVGKLPTRIDDVGAHPYRTFAADQLVRLGGAS